MVHHLKTDILFGHVNNTINTCLIKLNIILFYLFLFIKYLGMLNPLDMLPRQNWVGKLIFLLSALNMKIYFPFANK